MRAEIDRGRWNGGEGMATTVTLADRLLGLAHRVYLGTDGSFVETFPDFALYASIGGFIRPWPSVRIITED